MQTRIGIGAVAAVGLGLGLGLGLGCSAPAPAPPRDPGLADPAAPPDVVDAPLTVPLADGERLIASVPVRDDRDNGPLHLRVPEAVIVKYALAVEVAFDKASGPTRIGVELAGEGVTASPLALSGLAPMPPSIARTATPIARAPTWAVASICDARKQETGRTITRARPRRHDRKSTL